MSYNGRQFEIFICSRFRTSSFFYAESSRLRLFKFNRFEFIKFTLRIRKVEIRELIRSTLVYMLKTPTRRRDLPIISLRPIDSFSSRKIAIGPFRRRRRRINLYFSLSFSFQVSGKAA